MHQSHVCVKWPRHAQRQRRECASAPTLGWNGSRQAQYRLGRPWPTARTPPACVRVARVCYVLGACGKQHNYPESPGA